MLTATVATTIREATHMDVPRIVEMGQRFRRESAYADRLVENAGQMAALAERLVHTPEGVIFVAELSGVVIGMIALIAFPHHLSGALTVGEVVYWVEPEHRGCGIRLLKTAEGWARAQGATTLQLIAPTREVGQFYERLDYRQIEVAYEKDLTSCP